MICACLVFMPVPSLRHPKYLWNVFLFSCVCPFSMQREMWVYAQMEMVVNTVCIPNPALALAQENPGSTLHHSKGCGLCKVLNCICIIVGSDETFNFLSLT